MSKGVRKEKGKGFVCMHCLSNVRFCRMCSAARPPLWSGCGVRMHLFLFPPTPVLTLSSITSVLEESPWRTPSSTRQPPSRSAPLARRKHKNTQPPPHYMIKYRADGVSSSSSTFRNDLPRLPPAKLVVDGTQVLSRP